MANWAECRQGTCQTTEFWITKTSQVLKNKTEILNLECFSLFHVFEKIVEKQKNKNRTYHGEEGLMDQLWTISFPFVTFLF